MPYSRKIASLIGQHQKLCKRVRELELRLREREGLLALLQKHVFLLLTALCRFLHEPDDWT
jgi:hypothetical protein